MLRHTSFIGHLNIITMGSGCVVQIGDSNTFQSRIRAILVQREEPIFLSKEGSFEAYHIFTDTEITIPTRQSSVRMNVINENPFICVDSLTMNDLENSGSLHIGSTDYVFNNSRLLQIRQFISSDPFQDTPS